MVAWVNFGNGETPESSGLKGDKLVGKYYVEFDKHFNQQAKAIIEQWSTGDFSSFSDDTKNAYLNFEKAKEEDFTQYGSSAKNLYLLLLEDL